MIKARASGSEVYLHFMTKGRQARHRIPRNSRNESLLEIFDIKNYSTFAAKICSLVCLVHVIDA